MPGATLAVDVGTTHTVAVLRTSWQEARPLVFDGSPMLASGVFAEPSGVLHVGADAERLAQAEAAGPAGYEAHPRRRIDEPVIVLAGRQIMLVDVLGAVLYRVAGEAYRVAGETPGELVLTYPAAWGPGRRQALLDAAARAGLPQPRLIPEPVAAAAYAVSVLHRPIPPDRLLLVVDFGGGTLDVALVAGPPGFAVAGFAGLEDVGGLDLDAAVDAHVGGGTDPSQPEHLGQRRETWQRREILRAAKETLSREEHTQFRLPGRQQPATLTRPELERLAAPLVDRAVTAATGLLRERGITPDRLAGVLLVGGSSRMPLVSTALRGALGVEPYPVDRPETAVAQGALQVAPPSVAPTPAAAPPAAGKPRRSTTFRVLVILAALAVLAVLICGGGITAYVLYDGSEMQTSRTFPTAELRGFAKPWLGLISDCKDFGTVDDPKPDRVEDRATQWVSCDVPGFGKNEASIEFRQYADLATRDAARAELIHLSPQTEDLPGASGPVSGALIVGDGHAYWDDQAQPVSAEVIVWGGRPAEQMRQWWNRHRT